MTRSEYVSLGYKSLEDVLEDMADGLDNIVSIQRSGPSTIAKVIRDNEWWEEGDEGLIEHSMEKLVRIGILRESNDHPPIYSINRERLAWLAAQLTALGAGKVETLNHLTAWGEFPAAETATEAR